MLEFKCTFCEKILRVPEKAAGKKGKCRHCLKNIQVPATSTQSSEGFLDIIESAPYALPEEVPQSVEAPSKSPPHEQSLKEPIQESLFKRKQALIAMISVSAFTVLFTIAVAVNWSGHSEIPQLQVQQVSQTPEEPALDKIPVSQKQVSSELAKQNSQPPGRINQSSLPQDRVANNQTSDEGPHSMNLFRPEIPKTIVGNWKCEGVAWATTMRIKKNGAVLFNEGRNNEVRVEIKMQHASRCNFSSPELLDYNFDCDLKISGDRIVLIHPRFQIQCSALPVEIAGVPKRAAHVPQRRPIPGGSVRPMRMSGQKGKTADTDTANTRPAPRHNNDPVFEGEQYLLLGEWDRINSVPGFPEHIAILPDGISLFSDEKQKITKPPVVGKYRYPVPNEIEFTAPCLPGGTLRVEFIFKGNLQLVLKDPESRNILSTYHQSGGYSMELPRHHPDISSRNLTATGIITLKQALLGQILTAKIGSPNEALGAHQAHINIERNKNGFPGRLEIKIEPGTTVSSNVIISSSVQTDLKGKSTDRYQERLSSNNRCIIKSGKSTAHCRMTLYSSDPKKHISQVIKPGFVLIINPNTKDWSMPFIGKLFQEKHFDKYVPNHDKTVELLGAIWADRGLTALTKRFTKLPAATPGWPEAVQTVQSLLETRIPLNSNNQGDKNDSQLIGVWTCKIAHVLAADPTLDKSHFSAPGLSNPMTVLILNRQHQFHLHYPPIRGLTGTRIQGTWHKSNSKITLLPKYTVAQLESYKIKQVCLKTSRIDLILKNKELIFLKLPPLNAGNGRVQNSKDWQVLKKHVWMTGKPPEIKAADQIAQPMSVPHTQSVINSQAELNPPLQLERVIPGKLKMTLLAATAQAAPGVKQGATFHNFSDPVINAQGDVAFSAHVSGSNSSYQTVDSSASALATGIFLAKDQRLNQVAIAGQQVPGYSKSTRIQFKNLKGIHSEAFSQTIHLDDQGRVYFLCILNNMPPNQVLKGMTLARVDQNRLEHFIYSNMPISEDDNAQLVPRDQYTLHPSGAILVKTKIDYIKGLDADCTVWGEVGSPTLLTCSGKPSLETGAEWGLNYEALPLGKEQIVFRARIHFSQPKKQRYVSIWAGPRNDLKMILKEKDPIRLSSGPVQAGNPWILGSNIKGETLVSIDSRSQKIANSGRTLLLSSNGALKIIAEPNRPPKGSNVKSIVGWENSAVINKKGDIAALCNMYPNKTRYRPELSSGLWLWKEGKPRLLLKVPHTPKYSGTLGRSICLNSQCQVMLDVRGIGLCVLGSTGEITRLINRGDILEIAPGDRRIVDSYSKPFHSGGTDGRRLSLNDAGQVVFRVTFQNKTEAIIRVETNG